jgi:predicted MFS family arabinose efflux permease
MAAKSFGAVAAIAAAYGFVSGVFVSLAPTIYVLLTENRSMIGTRMGMGFSVASLGILVGTPISGALVGKSGYASTWVYGGVLSVAGAGLFCVSRLSRGGWSWKSVV